MKVENSEKSKNIRVGGYGGGVLKVENFEKSENIRVGGYGGGFFESQKFQKVRKYTGGGVLVVEYEWAMWRGTGARYGGVVRWGGTLPEMSLCILPCFFNF